MHDRVTVPPQPPSALLDALDIFAALLDREGVVVAANRAALGRGGLTLAQVAGRPFWDCAWWSHGEGARARLRDAVARVARGETLRLAETLRFADGALGPVDLTIAPLADPDGQVRWLVPSALEIGPRAALEAALRRSEGLAAERLAELESLYRTAPVGLCVLSRDLRFLRINDRLAEINGAPAEAHLGRPVRDMVPDLTAQAEAMLESVVRTGEPLAAFELTGETPAAPGVMRAWLETVSPVKGSDGAVTAISIAVEEITERKRLEAALREREAEARDLAERRALLMRELSHRVKNALATVGAMLSMQGRRAAPEIRAALDEAVRRVMAVSDVHDAFGRAADLDRIGAADFLGRICERTGALRPEIAVALEADPTIVIEGDRAGALGLLVSELLMNAIKHAYPAGRGGVAVVLRRDGEALVLSVEDGGIGLGDRWVSGSGGLGARIVEALAAQLGGALEVGPGAAGGARFALRFPSRRA